MGIVYYFFQTLMNVLVIHQYVAEMPTASILMEAIIVFVTMDILEMAKNVVVRFHII